MDGGAVGVAVDQGAHAKLLHHPWHFLQRDIDNVIGFMRTWALLSLRNLRASLWRVPQGRWRRINSTIGLRRMRRSFILAEVAGAEAVAVHQQHTGSPYNCTTVGSLSKVAPAALQNALPIRKSRLPCMMKIGVPLSLSSRRASQMERWKGVMPSSPIQASKKSQNVQRLGATGAAVEQIQKRPGNVRAFLFQMQV